MDDPRTSKANFEVDLFAADGGPKLGGGGTFFGSPGRKMGN